jgi:hypothetical protein
MTMTRLACCLVLLSAGATGALRADPFDDYTNRHLQKLVESKNVEKVKSASLQDLVLNVGSLPNVNSTYLVVRTNEGRFAKLLVQPARQKISKTESVPILMIERFVTFLDGEDRTVVAQGKNIRLFADFRFNLDIGQVVPASLPADLRFVSDGKNETLEPVGKAELFIVTKHLAEAAPPKGGKVAVGAAFVPQSFAGVYDLDDDGKRTGEMHLKVNETGGVTGSFYSAVGGTKYEVEGQVYPNPKSKVDLRILYPRSVQELTGWMFVSDGRAIVGVSKVNERETGFSATRKAD